MLHVEAMLRTRLRTRFEDPLQKEFPANKQICLPSKTASETASQHRCSRRWDEHRVRTCISLGARDINRIEISEVVLIAWNSRIGRLLRISKLVASSPKR